MDELEFKFSNGYWPLSLNGVEVGVVYEREHAELIVKAFKSIKTLEADITILNNQKRMLQEDLKELKFEHASFIRAENTIKAIASTIDQYQNE